MPCMMYDIIVFKNIRFRPSTGLYVEKTISRLFLINNSTLGTVLENLRFLVPENAV